MKRTSLGRKTPLKRISRKRRLARSMPMEEWEVKKIALDEFRAAARAQGCCQVTGGSDPWDAHHAVEKTWLKRNALAFVWDPRNALRITKRVHERHTNAFERIPLRCLTDANIEFAFEIQGPFAYDYLTRRYAGSDERVELAYERSLEVQDAAA